MSDRDNDMIDDKIARPTERRASEQEPEGFKERLLRYRRSRKWRRTLLDRRPFVPYGLVPAFGLATLLFIVTPIFATSVQHKAKRAAELALYEKGADWATVSASGQWITISGQAPDQKAVEDAKQAVRQVRVNTWLGMSRPVSGVRSRVLMALPEPIPTPSPTPVPTPTLTPTPVPTPTTNIVSPDFDWRFSLNNNILTMDGSVPDESTREALRTAARDAIDRGQIESFDDNLRVIGEAAPGRYEDVAVKGVSLLTRCENGRANMTDRRFTFRCEAL